MIYLKEEEEEDDLATDNDVSDSENEGSCKLFHYSLLKYCFKFFILMFFLCCSRCRYSSQRS